MRYPDLGEACLQISLDPIQHLELVRLPRTLHVGRSTVDLGDHGRIVRAERHPCRLPVSRGLEQGPTGAGSWRPRRPSSGTPGLAGSLYAPFTSRIIGARSSKVLHVRIGAIQVGLEADPDVLVLRAQHPVQVESQGRSNAWIPCLRPPAAPCSGCRGGEGLEILAPRCRKPRSRPRCVGLTEMSSVELPSPQLRARSVQVNSRVTAQWPPPRRPRSRQAA